MRTVLESLTRDYLRRGDGVDIAAGVARDRPAAMALEAALPEMGTALRHRRRARLAEALVDDGFEPEAAVRWACIGELEMAADVAEVARATGRPPTGVVAGAGGGRGGTGDRPTGGASPSGGRRRGRSVVARRRPGPARRPGRPPPPGRPPGARRSTPRSPSGRRWPASSPPPRAHRPRSPPFSAASTPNPRSASTPSSSPPAPSAAPSTSAKSNRGEDIAARRSLSLPGPDGHRRKSVRGHRRLRRPAREGTPTDDRKVAEQVLDMALPVAREPEDRLDRPDHQPTDRGRSRALPGGAHLPEPSSWAVRPDHRTVVVAESLRWTTGRASFSSPCTTVGDQHIVGKTIRYSRGTGPAS